MLTTVHSMKKASCPICLGIHEICSSCKIKAIFTPSLYRLSTLNGKAPRVSANWLILRKGRVLEAGLHIKTVLPIFARLASSQKSMILVGDQEKYLAVLWMRVNHIPQPVPGVCLLEVRGYGKVLMDNLVNGWSGPYYFKFDPGFGPDSRPVSITHNHSWIGQNSCIDRGKVTLDLIESFCITSRWDRFWVLRTRVRFLVPQPLSIRVFVVSIIRENSAETLRRLFDDPRSLHTPPRNGGSSWKGHYPASTSSLNVIRKELLNFLSHFPSFFALGSEFRTTKFQRKFGCIGWMAYFH